MNKEKNLTYTNYNDYNQDRLRILGYAYSRIPHQKSAVGLNHLAIGLVKQAIADCCETFWYKIPIERGQRSYLNRIVHNCVFDFAKQYKQKVEVKCRNKAVLKRVMADHEVAAYLKPVDTEVKSLTVSAIGKLFPSQQRALWDDDRVLEVRHRETRYTRDLADSPSEPCPVNVHLYQQIRLDFSTAVKTLAAGKGLEGIVAVECWLHGRPAREVAKEIKRSERCCNQMLCRFVVAFRDQYPEFRDYLSDLDRERQRLAAAS